MSRHWPNIVDLDFSDRIPMMKRKISLLFSLASHFGYQILIDEYTNSSSHVTYHAFLVAKNPRSECSSSPDSMPLPSITLCESGYEKTKEWALVSLFVSMSYKNMVSRTISFGTWFDSDSMYDFPWVEYAPNHEEDLDKLELDLVMLGAIRKDFQFKMIQENARSSMVLI